MDYSNASNQELEQLVSNKDGDAICELAERCMYGRGGHEVNLTRAYQLFHKGEKMGMSRAYVGLGEMYRNGIFFAKNENIAAEYFNKAGVPYPGDRAVPESENIMANNVAENSVGNNQMPDIELKAKLVSAEKARAAENYKGARKLCNDVICAVHNIRSGTMSYHGNEDMDDLLIEANWILAYTSFNEQKYQEMENYLAVDGVLPLHPWGAYLTAVSHRILQSPPFAFEQDVQMLVTVKGNQNLSQEERGDVCSMLGDLIVEGYGAGAGMEAGMAKSIYEEAMHCGNEYARSRYYELS